MSHPLRKHSLWVCTFAAAAALAACSGSSGTTATATPTPEPTPAPEPTALEVVAIEAKSQTPVNNLALDPNSVFEILFSEPVDALPQSLFAVCDLGGALRGQTSTTDGLRWQWQPAQQLPRGNTLEVRVSSGLTARSGNILPGDEAAAFVVRPSQQASLGPIIELPSLAPWGSDIAALVWPGGKRVALANNYAFEVTATGATQLEEHLPEETWTYGDDNYAFIRSNECVRGQLGGGTAPLPLPGDAASFASNWSGDIVAYVPQGTGPSTDWGVWRLRANETTWHWLGSVPAPADATLTLPSNGTPMLCFVEATTNRPTLARFAEGVPPDVHSAQSGSESVALVRATADESGHWQLLWVESDSVTNTVRRIRQEPGQAVTAAADILTFGPAGMPYMQSIRTSTRGAAIIHGGVSFVSSLLNCAGNTNETARVVRVEADGSLGAIEFLPIAAGAEVIDGISPERGEWMCFQHTICGNFVRQNTARPGGPLEANPTFLFGTFDLSKIVWAVNDSGQALLVAQAQYGPVLALLLD